METIGLNDFSLEKLQIFRFKTIVREWLQDQQSKNLDQWFLTTNTFFNIITAKLNVSTNE